MYNRRMLTASSKGQPTVNINEETLIKVYEALNRIDGDEQGVSLMETVAFFHYTCTAMK